MLKISKTIIRCGGSLPVTLIIFGRRMCMPNLMFVAVVIKQYLA